MGLVRQVEKDEFASAQIAARPDPLNDSVQLSGTSAFRRIWGANETFWGSLLGDTCHVGAGIGHDQGGKRYD